MQINFQRLKYFIAVAEDLNFTRAAQRMYISTQALNKQIIRLEEEIGCSLFERSTRTVRLTEAGERLYMTFAPIIQQYDTSCSYFSKWQRQQNRILKIGYFQAISRENVIKPLVHYLQELNHDIQIQVNAGEMDEVIYWIQEGSIDLCITNVHEYEVWCDAYENIELFQTPAVIVTAQNHPWGNKNAITRKEMEDAPILLMRQKKEMEAESFYHQIQGSEIIYMPNFNSLLMNLETGPYYAVFPKLFDGMQTEKLKYYELPQEFAFQFRMLMLYRNDNRFADLFRGVELGRDELDIHL